MCPAVLEQALPLIEEKFWDRVELPADSRDCWRWTGYLDEFGYGEYRIKNRKIKGSFRGHQMAYALAGLGVTNDGEVLHHVCENRWCVNPDHLEVKSRSEHMSHHMGDYCKRGHLRADNWWIRSDGQVGHCKECQRIREQERRRGTDGM